MAFAKIGPRSEPLPQIRQLMGREQAEVSRRKLQAGVARQGPQERHSDRLQRLRQQGMVAFASDTVEHDASQLQAWLVIAKSANERSQGAGLTAGFDHQHHR